MNLHALIATIVTSQPADWHLVGADDAGHCHAVLKSDVRIALAWDLGAVREFYEAWATGFADRHAQIAYFEISYQGAPVLRDGYVLVDGCRGYLPLPIAADDLHVAFSYARVVDLIAQLDGEAIDNTHYFWRAGLQLVDMPWPWK